MVVSQLALLSDSIDEGAGEIDARAWAGSFNARESSLHQLAPYVGKLKTGMVRVLINKYSHPGETVLDPFCGSGVVPLESLLLGRKAIGNDLNPYAYVLTMGKAFRACDESERTSACRGGARTY